MSQRNSINEAAVYGIPVIFGPNHAKFKEAADLIECGGGFCIATRDEFNEHMAIFSNSPAALSQAGKAAGDYIRRNLGATDLIYSQIFHENQPQ